MKIGTYDGSVDVVLSDNVAVDATEGCPRSTGRREVSRDVVVVGTRVEGSPVVARDIRGESLHGGNVARGEGANRGVRVTGAGGALQRSRVGGAERREGDEKRQELRGCGRGREGRGR
mgnify:CR=1 FL=1